MKENPSALLNEGNKNFQEYSDTNELEPAISRGTPEQGNRILAGKEASSCRISQRAETKTNLNSAAVFREESLCVITGLHLLSQDLWQQLIQYCFQTKVTRDL